jgi:hypothetical protein
MKALKEKRGVGTAPEEDYGGLHRSLFYLVRLCDAINRFLSYLQRPFTAISMLLQHWRGRIEVQHELDRWNRENRKGDDHEPLG